MNTNVFSELLKIYSKYIFFKISSKTLHNFSLAIKDKKHESGATAATAVNSTHKASLLIGEPPQSLYQIKFAQNCNNLVMSPWQEKQRPFCKCSDLITSALKS